MVPVLQVGRSAADQSEVGLIHDGRAAQGGLPRFHPEVIGGQPLQFVIDERHQLRQRTFISPAPSAQQVRDLAHLDLA
jgi:hypothetical protein